MIHHPVAVSRQIAAAPATIFAVLATPARHAEIDGSDMLQGAPEGAPQLRAVGDTFAMSMQQFGFPYRVENEVVELEPDRRIAWRPWVRIGGRKTAGGVTWRYELTPVDDDTLVTETYDITTGRGSHLFAALGYPTKMTAAMTRTLERLADLVE
jgi:uncharacterized protein YndB with AHSA1/START domain